LVENKHEKVEGITGKRELVPKRRYSLIAQHVPSREYSALAPIAISI
jgi:hypothetical protein